MGLLSGGFFSQPAASGWNPTNYGQISSNGDLVLGDASDTEFDPSDANCTSDAAIWVIRTGGNIYVRVGCSVGGNVDVNTKAWYDTGGSSQGDPGDEGGTGAIAFDLGTDSGVTVTITNTSDNTTSGTPTFGNVTGGGSYTSGNSFTPSEGTKYGRMISCASSQTVVGTDSEEGNFVIQFTFTKSGEGDSPYSITYKGHGKAVSIVSSL